MPHLEKLIDAVRSRINKWLNLDLIRVSGQHTLRAHIARILAQYDIDAVIDVGANEGHFGTTLREWGFQGEIYSFEPVAGAFAVLEALATKDEKWSAYNLALGANPGEATIHVSRFSQFSSILDANEFGLGTMENMKVEEHQQVEVKTLSQCFDEGKLPRKRRYLLKMDTQGYDVEVFSGAGNAIQDIRCMLSELSLIPIYRGMPHYLDALARYEQAGFRVSGMYPITRNADLTLNEMDCMLVRTGDDSRG